MKNDKFGKWLKDALKERGLTQADLSGRSGLSGASINKLANGQRASPRPATLVALANALELPPSTVLLTLLAKPPRNIVNALW